MTSALVLDVEGTTTPITFVYDVLFPYARARVEAFLAAHPDLVPALEEEYRSEPDAFRPWSPAGYVHWLMDRDRKSTALKALQGRIWEEGFRSGALRSVVYADVAPALRRARERGSRVAIYSSGSVLAQRLLFAHTGEGDLTPVIDAYFDTTTGPKRERESYGRIAAALGVAAETVLFVSDVAAELDAAAAAGLQTALCVRGDEVTGGALHRVIRTFDELGL